MGNQTEEQKEHFSPDRNHWCIVKYANHTPIYYEGYFGCYQGGSLLPTFGIDFNAAAKFHSRIAANEILNKLKRHVPESVKDCKVEDHKWM